MLARLTGALAALRDSVATAGNFTGNSFRFGARELRVFTRGEGQAHLPHGGLVPTSGAAAGIPLYVLAAGEVDGLPFPDDTVLGPYGALLDSVDTDWLILRNPDTGRVLGFDTVTRTGLYYPGRSVPPRDRAEFCRPLLSWLAILDGNVVVHAGAVASAGRGLLVAGAGNAGKSTLVRACVAAGFDFLGDNVVEVSGTGLHAVYPTVKVRPGGVIALPDTWPTPEWDDEARKHIAFLADAPGWGLPVDAPAHVATLVLDPRAGDAITSLPRARAFFEVAPNTVAQFPFFEELVLSRTRAVVGAAPTFTAGRLPVESIVDSVASLLGETVHVS